MYQLIRKYRHICWSKHTQLDDIIVGSDYIFVPNLSINSKW